MRNTKEDAVCPKILEKLCGGDFEAQLDALHVIQLYFLKLTALFSNTTYAKEICLKLELLSWTP